MNMTENGVLDFAQNKGSLLERALKKLDNSRPNTSYIHNPWMNMYLKDRRPLVFNTTGGLVLNSSQRERDDMAKTAARLLISSMRFAHIII